MTEKNINCKVCGGKTVYLCDTPNEHSQTKFLHHHRCLNCNLVFVGNSFDNRELGEAYSALDAGQYYDEIKAENARKFVNSIKNLEKLVKKDSKIIDIGTGDGSFLKMLHENGYTQISGHEIPGGDLSEIEKLGGQIYQDFDFQTVPSNTFDAATLLDVAEHVPDPLSLFASCNRILKPGGIIYFHTPVVTKTDRLMHLTQKFPFVGKFGRAWQRGRTSIFHLQNYTDQSLKMLLKETGFEHVSITVKNELSWPVQRYTKVYFCGKLNLPTFLAPIATPFFYPFLATNFFNPNKAVVWAQKCQ